MAEKTRTNNYTVIYSKFNVDNMVFYKSSNPNNNVIYINYLPDGDPNSISSPCNIQTPEMHCPFGISDNNIFTDHNDKKKMDKTIYSMKLTFKNMTPETNVSAMPGQKLSPSERLRIFYNKIREMESKIVEKLIENRWLDDELIESADLMTIKKLLLKSCIRPEKKTMRNGERYPDYIKFKFDWDEENDCPSNVKLFKEGETKDKFVEVDRRNWQEVNVPRSMVTTIFQFRGVSIMDKVIQPIVRIRQLRLRPVNIERIPPKLEGYQFHSEDGQENHDQVEFLDDIIEDPEDDDKEDPEENDKEDSDEAFHNNNNNNNNNEDYYIGPTPTNSNEEDDIDIKEDPDGTEGIEYGVQQLDTGTGDTEGIEGEEDPEETTPTKKELRNVSTRRKKKTNK